MSDDMKKHVEWRNVYVVDDNPKGVPFAFYGMPMRSEVEAVSNIATCKVIRSMFCDEIVYYPSYRLKITWKD
jgi:hypothetical protein